jgi:hypothetical protein
MKKSIGLSLVAATLLAGNAAAMDLAGGTLGGDARVQYFSTTPSKTDATSSMGLGLNPDFNMEVASGLSIEVGAGVAVPVMESDDGVAAGNTHAKLNDDGDKSEMYALLNKYNVTYNFGSGFVKVGAQDLDTPFAGPDDIRLVRNTFTAAVVGYTGIKNVTLIGAQVLSMAGAFDSASSKDSYAYNTMSDAALGSLEVDTDGDGEADVAFENSDVDDKAVTAVAAVYGNEEAGANGQLWYYTMPEPLDGLGAISAMYLDAGMAFDNINVAAQYMTFTTDIWSNSATGVMVDATFGDFGVVVATNSYSQTIDKADDAAAIGVNGPAWYAWGGYPEYAVADEVWANSADWDGGSSMKVGASYAGVENLDLSAAYVTFSDVASIVDVMAGYTISEQLSANLTYETVTYDEKNSDGDDGHTILKVGAAYAF